MLRCRFYGGRLRPFGSVSRFRADFVREDGDENVFCYHPLQLHDILVVDADAAVAAPSGNRAGSIRAVDADARIERRVERKKERAVAFLIGVFVSPVCRYIGSVEFEGALRGLAVVAGFLLSAFTRRSHG